MTQRESHLLWLKDIVEHLRESCAQLEWTEDPQTARLQIDEMIGDLECGKKICEQIKARAPLRGRSMALGR
jgi:hypothetical protein